MNHNPEVYNFSSGPACLPPFVLEKIKAELTDWRAGMSVMEVSHRSEAFLALMKEMTERFKKILNIPKDFEVLYMHGGARMQFSAIPFNLFAQEKAVNYLVTGHWSKAAAAEAKKYAPVHIVADGESSRYTKIPPQHEWQINLASHFLHYTDNETIQGVEFSAPPETDLALISDMTSSILSKPLDFSKYGLIYASAQKNLGIAGLTVVIIHKRFLDPNTQSIHPLTPSILNYQVMAESQSLYNTPPVFALYVLYWILKWAEQMGGISYFETKAKRVSQALYDFIDNSAFYQTPVDPNYRSRLNIPFSLPSPELEAAFLKEASQKGLMFLEGHRSVGGCRASLYNAMPEAGVKALISFMQSFEKTQS